MNVHHAVRLGGTAHRPLQLRNPAFGLLWTGRLLSATGTWLMIVAVPVYVLHLTGSARDTALAFAAEVVPMLVLGPAGGVLADRLSYRLTMIVSDLVRAGSVLAMVLVRHPGQFGLLLAAIVAENAAGAFFTPAHNGLLPSVVGRGRDLDSANAWYSVSTGVVRLAGAPAGGALYVAAGFGVTATVDAVSYLVSAALVAAMPVAGRGVAGRAVAGDALAGSALAGSALAGSALAGSALAGSAAAGRASAGRASAGSASAGRASAGRPAAGGRTVRGAASARRGLGQFVREVRQGFGELHADRMLRVLLCVSGLFLFGNGALSGLLVPYVVTDLRTGPTTLGVLFSALGAGFLISGWVGRVVSRHRQLRRAVIGLLLAAAAAFAGLFDWHALPAALVFIGLLGVAGGAFLMVRQTVVQRRAAPAVIGRISASFGTAEMAATLAGAGLASLAVPRLGLPVTLNLAIAVVAAAAALAFRLPRQD